MLNSEEGKIYISVHSAPRHGDSYIYANKTFQTKTADSDQTAVLHKQSLLYAACSGFRGD